MRVSQVQVPVPIIGIRQRGSIVVGGSVGLSHCRLDVVAGQRLSKGKTEWHGHVALPKEIVPRNRDFVPPDRRRSRSLSRLLWSGRRNYVLVGSTLRRRSTRRRGCNDVLVGSTHRRCSAWRRGCNTEALGTGQARVDLRAHVDRKSIGAGIKDER